MPLHHNEIYMSLEAESRLLADQLRANKGDYDLINFMEAERKKYKKSNEIEEMINNYRPKF